MDMDWRDSKMCFTNSPMFKDLSFNSKKHVFPKERMKTFWDHIVHTFVHT